jgi:hypothetical protein
MMLDLAHGRGLADGKGSAGKVPRASTISAVDTQAPVLALAAASKAWWESRRPQGWTFEQHLADPTAGCNGTADDQALAQAVAGWLRQRR